MVAAVALSLERLIAIANAGGLALELVTAWCTASWSPAQVRWLETAPPGEVAVWIEANARETDRIGEGSRDG